MRITNNDRRRLWLAIGHAFSLMAMWTVHMACAFEVRIVDPLEPIYDVESALEALAGEELLLTAPRGGGGSAQVVVIGSGAGRVPVRMGPLTGEGVEFPARSVAIRYAWKEADFDLIIREERETGEPHPDFGPNYLHAYHDRLMPEPDAESDIQPVWVTVTAPEDTLPGVYTGQLNIGESSVPVRLHVSAWIAPGTSEFSTHVGIVSSHEILAMHYGVEFWSDEHWALIEQQMKYLGALGAKELWLYINADLGQGKGLALVHFTEKDGEIVPDLRVAERYTDLFAEHVGEPSYVNLYYWMGPPRRDRTATIPVFVDGERRLVPRPQAEGGEQFWSRVMDGIRELVSARGWPEEIIHLALADDRRPVHDGIEAWQRIAPGIAWVAWTHGKGDPSTRSFEDGEPIVAGGIRFGNYVSPYLPRPTIRERYRASGKSGVVVPHLQGGWNQGKPLRASGRNILLKYMRPNQWRNFPNGTMLGSRETGHDDHHGAAGFGFLALDFWDVGVSYRSRFLDAGYYGSLHRQNSASVIEPAPDGPVPTVRFEMLREGLQETEARVVVERALVEGFLPEALAEEARALLAEMYQHRWRTWTNQGFATRNVRTSNSFLWGVAPYPEWIHLTARLYDMAARVEQ